MRGGCGSHCAWRPQRALAGLGRPPDSILIDGPLDLVSASRHPVSRTFAGSVHPIKGGDARCASVAAASVLAKVVRDRLMRAESEHFPAYGFERNKGYPSRGAPHGVAGATACRPSTAAVGPSPPISRGTATGRREAERRRTIPEGTAGASSA